jgi:hypothetical protein
MDGIAEVVRGPGESVVSNTSESAARSFSNGARSRSPSSKPQ